MLDYRSHAGKLNVRLKVHLWTVLDGKFCMRDYLYIWHDLEKTRLIVSGVEFCDFLPNFSETGGLILLEHGHEDAISLFEIGFDGVFNHELHQLAKDDIDGYGDFIWVDYDKSISLRDLSEQSVAELLYFSHRGKPLVENSIRGLSNKFLYHGHDDGWRTYIYYSDWSSVDKLLYRLLLNLTLEREATALLMRIREGSEAFLCRKNDIISCEKTEDIDLLQRRYLT
jgi:hypothetical protein